MTNVNQLTAVGFEGIDPKDIAEIETAMGRIYTEAGELALTPNDPQEQILRSDVVSVSINTGNGCEYSTWKSCNPCN